MKYSLLLRQNYKGRRLRVSRRGNLLQNLNQNLPNSPDTAQNILHNLNGLHEATYAQDCTNHLSPPLLILVLALLLLLLAHQGNRPGTLPLRPQPDRFQFRTMPGPGTHPERPPGTFPNIVAEHCPGTLKPLPRTCPGTSLIGTCPGTLSEPCPEHAPKPCPEPAPEPSRNPLPEPAPEPSRNPVPEDCPGTCPGTFLEPVVRKPPRHRPGTYIG